MAQANTYFFDHDLIDADSHPRKSDLTDGVKVDLSPEGNLALPICHCELAYFTPDFKRKEAARMSRQKNVSVAWRTGDFS